MLKNQKGITMVSLVITIILIFLILGTIVYNSQSVYDLEVLNNMYIDIRTLDDKVAMYYLNYGVLPVKKDDDGNLLEVEIIETAKKDEFKNINPNNSDIYYEIDTSLLGSLTLTNSAEDDVFVINSETHTIYYLSGVTSENKTYYTTPTQYTNIIEFYNQGSQIENTISE